MLTDMVLIRKCFYNRKTSFGLLGLLDQIIVTYRDSAVCEHFDILKSESAVHRALKAFKKPQVTADIIMYATYNLSSSVNRFPGQR